jgi:hypothetical protein
MGGIVGSAQPSWGFPRLWAGGGSSSWSYRAYSPGLSPQASQKGGAMGSQPGLLSGSVRPWEGLLLTEPQLLSL